MFQPVNKMSKRQRVNEISTEGGFQFEWIEWSRDHPAAFNRALSSILLTDYDALGCDRGDENYWEGVKNDAHPSSLTHQPYLFIVNMTMNFRTVGFCLIRRGKLCTVNAKKTAVCKYPIDAWYIEFICSEKGKGFGKKLMNEIHRRATLSGIKYISLSALPEVIMFYHQLGYKLTLNLECLEKKNISEVAETVRQELERRKQQRLSIPKDLDEMWNDPIFAQLVISSVQENLSSIQLRNEPCATDKECARDGIYMLICLHKKVAGING
jgi:Acetyltransferase (GNAT) domain